MFPVSHRPPRFALGGGSPSTGVAASAALHAAREAPGAALLARWSDEAGGVKDPMDIEMVYPMVGVQHDDTEKKNQLDDVILLIV